MPGHSPLALDLREELLTSCLSSDTMLTCFVENEDDLLVSAASENLLLDDLASASQGIPCIQDLESSIRPQAQYGRLIVGPPEELHPPSLTPS